jgi:hypothetical protein
VVLSDTPLTEFVPSTPSPENVPRSHTDEGQVLPQSQDGELLLLGLEAPLIQLQPIEQSPATDAGGILEKLSPDPIVELCPQQKNDGKSTPIVSHRRTTSMADDSLLIRVTFPDSQSPLEIEEPIPSLLPEVPALRQPVTSVMPPLSVDEEEDIHEVTVLPVISAEKQQQKSGEQFCLEEEEEEEEEEGRIEFCVPVLSGKEIARGDSALEPDVITQILEKTQEQEEETLQPQELPVDEDNVKELIEAVCKKEELLPTSSVPEISGPGPKLFERGAVQYIVLDGYDEYLCNVA